MRSGWEVDVADYLTEQKLDWYYEVHWLELTNSLRYLPDFYLPRYNLYIEVKGRIKEKDLRIVNLMSKYGYNFLFWNGEELLKRGIVGNCGVAEINNKYRDSEPYTDDWNNYLINK